METIKKPSARSRVLRLGGIGTVLALGILFGGAAGMASADDTVVTPEDTTTAAVVEVVEPVIEESAPVDEVTEPPAEEAAPAAPEVVEEVAPVVEAVAEPVVEAAVTTQETPTTQTEETPPPALSGLTVWQCSGYNVDFSTDGVTYPPTQDGSYKVNWKSASGSEWASVSLPGDSGVSIAVTPEVPGSYVAYLSALSPTGEPMTGPEVSFDLPCGGPEEPSDTVVLTAGVNESCTFVTGLATTDGDTTGLTYNVYDPSGTLVDSGTEVVAGLTQELAPATPQGYFTVSIVNAEGVTVASSDVNVTCEPEEPVVTPVLPTIVAGTPDCFTVPFEVQGGDDSTYTDLGIGWMNTDPEANLSGSYYVPADGPAVVTTASVPGEYAFFVFATSLSGATVIGPKVYVDLSCDEEPCEPVDPTDPTDPTDPVEPTEPTEPIVPPAVVTPPTSKPTTTEVKALAATGGADSSWLGIVGGVAVLGGLWLTLRRRSAVTPAPSDSSESSGS